MGYGNDYALDRGYEGSESMSAERAAFIRRTYGHLAGAIAAFALILTGLLSIPNIAETVFGTLGQSRFMWLAVLAAFVVVGNLAHYWANSQTSRTVQYIGLGVYVVLEAVIFLPIMIVATKFMPDANIIPTAGILTLAVFAGLTAVVFVTKKDFSFLGTIITIGSFIAIGAIIAAIIMGFTLGLFFCVAIIVLMAAAILYDTSNILHHYGTDQHVAASLSLFASVATLFWWIIRLLMILSDRG